jgi:hypothetical protein
VGVTLVIVFPLGVIPVGLISCGRYSRERNSGGRYSVNAVPGGRNSMWVLFRAFLNNMGVYNGY